MTNVWIAAADNDVETVKRLITAGTVSPNSKDHNGYTPIHAAASYGHIDLVRWLLANGGDVNVVDNDGDTPLHAVEDAATAAVLLELGASQTARNSDGQTPLEKAQDEEEYPELIAALRRAAGIDVPELPEGARVRVGYQNAPEGADDSFAVSEEQRAELGRIVASGNDSDLEAFLKKAMAGREDADVSVDSIGGAEGDADAAPAKRRHK